MQIQRNHWALGLTDTAVRCEEMFKSAICWCPFVFNSASSCESKWRAHKSGTRRPSPPSTSCWVSSWLAALAFPLWISGIKTELCLIMEFKAGTRILNRRLRLDVRYFCPFPRLAPAESPPHVRAYSKVCIPAAPGGEHVALSIFYVLGVFSSICGYIIKDWSL